MYIYNYMHVYSGRAATITAALFILSLLLCATIYYTHVYKYLYARMYAVNTFVLKKG